LFDRRLRGPCDIKRQLGLELAFTAENANAVLDAANHAGLDQRRSIDRFRCIQLLGVDRHLDAGERNGVEVVAERILEAALGQAAIKRHLAALEAVDGNAGTRLLTLHTATAGLAR